MYRAPSSHPYLMPQHNLSPKTTKCLASPPLHPPQPSAPGFARNRLPRQPDPSSAPRALCAAPRTSVHILISPFSERTRRARTSHISQLRLIKAQPFELGEGPHEPRSHHGPFHLVRAQKVQKNLTAEKKAIAQVTLVELETPRHFAESSRAALLQRCKFANARLLHGPGKKISTIKSKCDVSRCERACSMPTQSCWCV